MTTENRFVVGYLTPGQVSAGFCYSLVMLATNDKHYAGVIARTNGVDLCQGRNRLAESFLQSNMAWLLMLDSDISFPPTLFQHLLEQANETTIAVGPYYSFNSETREVNSILYDENSKVINPPQDDHEPFQIWATGAGCMLIHREALRKIKPPCFTQSEKGLYLEDVGFCENARLAGIKLVCVPSVRLGHTKQITIWPEDFFAYERNKPQD